MSDTIFALASAPGKAGVCLFRISGGSAHEIAAVLCGALPANRGLRYLKAVDGTVLDQALVLVFARGSSFTGEPVVELHCHGSPAVVISVSEALADAGAHLAEPGEFTRRALENEQLDLSQVEGLSDLIEAETEAQRKQAFALMAGGLTQKVAYWRTTLIRAAALVEATIDFADEDVPVDVTPEVASLMRTLTGAIEREIEGSYVAERVRGGFEVAIVGPPNIGKSTLLNALAGRDAAITSEIAGTTRDVIEVRMDMGGIPVTVLDTAGLRETTDIIESLGVNLARDRANSADLRVFLTEDGSCNDLGLVPVDDDLILFGKSDTRKRGPARRGLPEKSEAGQWAGISGKTGDGLDALIEHVTQVFSGRVATTQSAVRQRHRIAMQSALGYLETGRELMEDSRPAELIALELNAAGAALSSLIGQVGVEDVLDEIFASFCLGK